MEERTESDSSTALVRTADHLRLEILSSMQTAPSDTGRHLLSADDALDGSVSSDEDDTGDLDLAFTAQNGAGLRIKAAGEKPSFGTRQTGCWPSRRTPGPLGGGKLIARSDSTSVVLQSIMDRLQLDEIRLRVHIGQNSQAYCAMNHDKSMSYYIKIFTNGKRPRLMKRAQREHELLSRAFESRVRVPEPVLCQEHILVTRLVEKYQKPLPSLADVKAKHLHLGLSYVGILGSIRRLYWVTGLVHGNVSEHTVLLCSRYTPWLTDFGHALDRDHVDSLTLLEKDLVRINAFFSKRGLKEATADTLGLLPVDKAMALTLQEKDPRNHFCAEYRECGVHVSIYSNPQY